MHCVHVPLKHGAQLGVVLRRPQQVVVVQAAVHIVVPLSGEGEGRGEGRGRWRAYKPARSKDGRKYSRPRRGSHSPPTGAGLVDDCHTPMALFVPICPPPRPHRGPLPSSHLVVVDDVAFLHQAGQSGACGRRTRVMSARSDKSERRGREGGRGGGSDSAWMHVPERAHLRTVCHVKIRPHLHHFVCGHAQPLLHELCVRRRGGRERRGDKL